MHTGNDNGTEHHDGASAENTLGKRSEELSDGRQEAGEKHHHRTGRNRKAVYHLRHRNQSDVLREGSYRAATEECGDGGSKAVTGKRTGNLFFRNFPVETRDHHRRRISDGFRRGYEENDASGENRTDVELRHHGKNVGKRNQPFRENLGIVYLSYDDGTDIAYDKTCQHG